MIAAVVLTLRRYLPRRVVFGKIQRFGNECSQCQELHKQHQAIHTDERTCFEFTTFTVVLYIISAKIARNSVCSSNLRP